MQTLELLERPRSTPPTATPERRVAPPLAAYRPWLVAALWIVPLVMGLAAGTAALITSRQAPVYRSTATLAVVPGAALEEVPELLRGIETLERRTVVATIARLPSTTRIRTAAAEALGPSSSLAGYSARGSVIPNTNLVRIEVEGPDPARAAAIANALGAATAAAVHAMYRVIEMSPLADAVPPRGPAAPNPRRALVLALVLGGFVGLGATYLYVRLRAPGAALA